MFAHQAMSPTSNGPEKGKLTNIGSIVVRLQLPPLRILFFPDHQGLLATSWAWLEFSTSALRQFVCREEAWLGAE